MENRWGNNENSDRLYFSWTPKPLRTVIAATTLKGSCRKVMTNLDSVLKSRDISLLTGVSSHVWMWELDYKEG